MAGGWDQATVGLYPVTGMAPVAAGSAVGAADDDGAAGAVDGAGAADVGWDHGLGAGTGHESADDRACDHEAAGGAGGGVAGVAGPDGSIEDNGAVGADGAGASIGDDAPGPTSVPGSGVRAAESAWTSCSSLPRLGVFSFMT